MKRSLIPPMVMMLATAALGIRCMAVEPAVARPETHASLKAATDAAAADQTLVLLVFSATWCGPCKLLKSQTLESEEFLERGGALHVVDIDVDADPKTSQSFNASAIPTLVLMTADGKIVARQTGFISALDLVLWIEKARVRANAGEWVGTAPSDKLDEFVHKAETDNLNTNDLQQLLGMLAATEPTERSAVVKLLTAQREAAVPGLIIATGDPYLGLRIAASELLQEWAPDAPVSDPWQSPAERTNSVALLEQWWASGGKLAPATSAPETSTKEMLDRIRGENPAQRTEAMAGLVRQGAAALPMIREAIRKAERAGDQQSISLLEDVRWAILVPDELEQRTGALRSILSRGKSTERQAAPNRLAHAGRDGLDAIIELLGDSDPLVVESAVRAISSFGSKETVPALSALLQSSDGNLRMTAAQALGHTKNSEAMKPLTSVFADPNEIVACTALAALEEIRAGNGYQSSKEPLPQEAKTALRESLADSRWRVRAKTTEVIGKIQAKDLTEDVKKLLDDADGFVVKNVLVTLSSLNATPEVSQLTAVAQRLPGLRADTVEMIIASHDSGAVKTITELYEAGRPDDQLAILNVLAKGDESWDRENSNDEWKPLLGRAATASDVRLRRAAAAVLLKKPPKLSAELVGPLLVDDDSRTRTTAAQVVLGILDANFTGDSGRHLNSSRSAQTNLPVATAEQLAAWHTAMTQHMESNTPPSIAAAVFLTGDGKSDLPLIEKTLGATSREAGRQHQETLAVGLIVAKLTWPEGKSVLETICASPTLFAMAVNGSTRAAPDVARYLLEPVRFKRSVEPAAGDELNDALNLLAGYDSGEKRGWSLWAGTDLVRAVDLALLESTNVAWRAAAVFSLGLREESENDLPIFRKAARDDDVWVRVAATQAMAAHAKDRPTLEQWIVPMLGDTNLQVAMTAACALLEPEVRLAANVDQMLKTFRFDEHAGGRSQDRASNEERPLSTLDPKPAYLQTVREWLHQASGTDVDVFALLLAQFGEMDGVDSMISRDTDSSTGWRDRQPMLTGIALSRDVKYLPALRKFATATKEEWELRQFLQALKGMTGPDARQLRLEINKRMRDASRPSGMMID